MKSAPPRFVAAACHHRHHHHQVPFSKHLVMLSALDLLDHLFSDVSTRVQRTWPNPNQCVNRDLYIHRDLYMHRDLYIHRDRDSTLTDDRALSPGPVFWCT